MNAPVSTAASEAPVDRVTTPSFARSLHGLWLLTWKSARAWRRAVLWVAALFANPLLAWLSIPRGGDGAFLDWTVHLYLDLLIPLICLVVCGGMIRDEVQDDTLGFLITRPVTRARLYLAKYLCQLPWLQAVALVNGGLLLLVGMRVGAEGAASLAWRVLAGGALAVLVYGALGGLFGLITRRYIVLGLVYGFIVEVGIGHIPTNINSLSMMRHVQTLLAGNRAVADRYDWSPEGAVTGVLIMLGATLVALGAGAVLFTWKEMQPGQEAPK